MKSVLRASAVALSASVVMLVTPAAGQAVHSSCSKLYSLEQFQQAAETVYAGIDLPPVGSYGSLWRYLRCQRQFANKDRAAFFWRAQEAAWANRRHPFSEAFVSWYDDSGGTASGWHAADGEGFATCGSGGGPCLAFGTQVEFCFPVGSSHCITGTADDHGPYVAGRSFDLNQNMEAYLGFDGLGEVSWRIL